MAMAAIGATLEILAHNIIWKPRLKSLLLSCIEISLGSHAYITEGKIEMER